MARTTAAAVRKLIVVSDTLDIDPFIETATAFVTRALVNSDAYDETEDAVILEILERWLAAHFTAILKPRTNEEEADLVRDRFDSKVDLGLNVTRYGQQAIVLDTTGTLAALATAATTGGKIKQSILWLGKPPRC